MFEYMFTLITGGVGPASISNPQEPQRLSELASVVASIDILVAG